MLRLTPMQLSSNSVGAECDDVSNSTGNLVNKAAHKDGQLSVRVTNDFGTSDWAPVDVEVVSCSLTPNELDLQEMDTRFVSQALLFSYLTAVASNINGRQLEKDFEPRGERCDPAVITLRWLCAVYDSAHDHITNVATEREETIPELGDDLRT
mgnify:CR=1 FL=1